MTTRKRRPGAGRKPSGGFAGKSAWLSTRITPETRASLERAAASNGQSLSQEIERRLRESFAFSNRGSAHGPPPDHLKALFYLIGEVARRTSNPMRDDDTMKWTTGDWRNNRFLFEGFKAAVVKLLDRLAPEGQAEDTKHVNFKTPEELANAVAFSIWNDLEHPPVTEAQMKILRPESGSPLYAYPQAARALNITQTKETKS